MPLPSAHLDLSALSGAAERAVDLAEEQVFELETLPSYNETDDPDVLAAYEAVERGDMKAAWEIHERALVGAGWHARIQERGLKHRRVRLVKQPFSEYLLYEFAVWKVNLDHGEEILIVEDKDLGALRRHGYLQDFLMFDERQVLFNEYAERVLSGADRSEDPRTLRDCALLRDGLLWVGTPLKEFLAALR